MNFELVKGQALNICTFGVVRLRHGLIGHMKESWTKKQLAVILLAMLNTLGAINFTIPPQDPFLRREMQDFLRKLSLGRKRT